MHASAAPVAAINKETKRPSKNKTPIKKEEKKKDADIQAELLYRR
jgi:hypothetical protein